MANRKTDEKLKVPVDFRLKSYSPLRSWREPRPWLEQFAFRIDLLLLWQKISTQRQPTDSAKTSMSVAEFYLDEMLGGIWDAPLASVRGYFDDYPRTEVEFPTLELVERGFDPVRRMNALDLYLAECTLHPLTRDWGRAFSHRLQSGVPYPEEELRCADLAEDEAAFLSYEPATYGAARGHLLKRYWQNIEENVRRMQFYDPLVWPVPQVGSYGFPLLQLVGEESPKTSSAYFVVDTNVPYTIAEKSFKKQFEARQNEPSHSKRFDTAVLAGWCDDGVLPYMDLKIFERIESDRRNNPKLSITDEEIADAIYCPSPARSSTCVSDTTRPVATNLMNPTSSLFRSLLVTAGGPIQ